MKPYTSKLHEVRGFKGAIRSAKAINKMVEGGDEKERLNGEWSNPIKASVSIMAFKVFSMLSVKTRSQLAGSKLLSGLKARAEINVW